MPVSVYVCGISAQVSKKQIVDHFSQIGPVLNYIPKSKNGTFAGYGFIEYETQQEAEAAVSQLDHTYLPGIPNRYLKVNFASKEEVPEETRTVTKLAGKTRLADDEESKINFNYELVPREIQSTLKSLNAQSVYDMLLAMRYYAIKHPRDARILLAENPALAHCLSACLAAYNEITEDELKNSV